MPAYILKYFVLIILFNSVCLILSAQSIISGKIRDSKTSEALPFANVFINNTTLGAAANEKGEYQLKNIPAGLHEVVFSFVGYETYSTKIRIGAGETILLNIKLRPSEKQLDNVSINGTRDKEWGKRLKRFERVFLGSTKSASHTKILNPWCIELSENTEGNKRELIATTSLPIEIENLDLGYKIYYDLKTFISTNYYYRFSGNVFFTEIKTTDEIQAARWTKNRLRVYQGSARHFFKAVLDNRVKEEGFKVFAFKPEFEKKQITRSTVFFQDLDRILTAYNPSGFFLQGRHPGEFKLTLKPKIEIHYLRATSPIRTYRDIDVPVAGMEIAGGSVLIDKAGVILNPSVLTTSGYMSESRVSDLLPYDYEPGQNIDFIETEPVSKSEINLDRLKEQVYLHTDKSYYYPGEVIWFKGYMKYNYPEILDSLSAVLHVDLINSNHTIVQTKMFSIDSGRVQGDLLLPGSLSPGNYVLRAYTNWMRNYSSHDFFMKPLPVLRTFDNLEAVTHKVEKNISQNLMEIKSDKESYHLHDSIGLSISLKDEYDNPILADLSVSVTDANEIMAIPEQIITEHFLKTDTATKQLGHSPIVFPVEHGISLSGEFKNDRGKPEKMKIQIIQGNFEDVAYTSTDDLGIFWISGFQFNDSLEFALRATNEKGKAFGKIIPHKYDTPLLPDSLPALGVSLRKQEFKERSIQRYDESGPVRVLKEVIINGTKIEKQERRPFSRYGTPDNSIKGEILENANYGNLIYVIQGRIPGLRINFINGAYVASLGGFATFGKTAKGDVIGAFDNEPLLLIDGVAYNGDDGIVSMINQLAIPNILRIDVFKFGNAAAFGARGANGVIAIYTKNGNAQKEQKVGFDKSLYQLMQLGGYTVPRIFKSPNYSLGTKENSDPDFRTTIYWQPFVKTNPKTGEAVVSFYAADLETTYRIIVEGVTSTGVPVHAEQIIKISK